MKLKGRKLDTPKNVLLVLPRDEGDLVFKFQAVADDKEFDDICPMPKVPMKKIKDQDVPDPTDPGYKAVLEAYARNRANWLFLKSISVTDGLEWETVKMDTVSTWDNWRSELTSSGLATQEQNRMWDAFSEANSLDNAKIEEARRRFLATQEVRAS